MIAFLELLKMALYSVVSVIIDPTFWVVMFLVYYQYKRIQQIEIKMLGSVKTSIGQILARTTFIGLLGGIIGTIVIMLLGITVEIKDFTYLLPLAILLMLVNVRYLCFSYGGGLLSLAYLIFGFPKINVPSMMAVVAILHLVESILIRVDGYRDAAPIFLEDSRYGIIGGFTLQRFWPIPFAILLAMLGPLENGTELNFPDWWPIFKSNLTGIDMDKISLQLTTVVAALGYGDLTLSRNPKEKSKSSSLRLFIYSLILLFLSAISTKIAFFQWIAALFAPLGHEALILYGQKEEKRAAPIFRPHSAGITILDTRKNQPGEVMGLQPGDTIVRMNGVSVNSKEDLSILLNQFPTYIWLEVIDIKGKIRTIEYQDYQKGIHSLGLLIVNKDVSVVFDAPASISLLKKLIKKIYKK